MGILTSLNEAKGAIVAITAVGGGGIALNNMHVNQDDYDAYVSGNRVQTILSLAEQSKNEGSPAYLCRALQSEFAALCTELPNHYFCEDPDARKEIMAKAGCSGR